MTPSRMPTPDCAHFVFGSDCVGTSTLDLLIVLDTSNSNTDYTFFTERISANLLQLPPGARVAPPRARAMAALFFRTLDCGGGDDIKLTCFNVFRVCSRSVLVGETVAIMTVR